MKSKISFGLVLCVLCIMAVCLLPQQVNAAECDGFTYEVRDGKATITGCTKENVYMLEIPQTIDDYPVVGIGAEAFFRHPTLLDLKIPEGVETIGTYAFGQCSNLSWVELPDSLTTIEDKAFYNCVSLINVWFGYNLKTIGEGAFAFCYYLDDILILPYKLESIGASAFYDCNTLEQVTLPDSLKEIGSKAFAMCDRLEYIVMPSNLEKLGANVFYQSACYNRSYNWHDDMFRMGSYLLNAKTSISGSCEVWPRITHIADEAFLNCDNLTEIILPEDLQVIGTAAFKECDGLTNVVFPNGLTTIQDQAFYGCDVLADIQIPDSVTYIGQGTFDNTAYYKSAENWQNGVLYVGNCLVQCNSSLSGTLQVRPGTTTIVSGAMKDQTKLTELILPDSVTRIGGNALYGCSALKTIHLGKGVSYIGSGAFGQCPSLESINVHSDNVNYCSRNNCLISLQDRTLVLGCKESQIPEDGTVTRIGAFAFEGCKGLVELIIPNTISHIEEGAFRDCNSLTTVKLGDGVQVVGKRAFEECDVLSKVDFGQSVHTVDDFGFAYNHCLTQLEFPASLRYLGEEAFSNSTSLVSVTFQEGLISIGQNCFCFCENLLSAHLPDSVVKLEMGAFYACERLEELTLGDNLESIEAAAFSDCEALQTVSIPDRVETIGSSAFYRCTSLRALDLGNVKKIGDSAFESCNLKQIYIPASVTEIGRSVFGFCTSMEQMEVSYDNKYYHSQGNCIINTKDKYLVSGCKNSIIPADGSVTILDKYCFAGCTGLKSIVVPDQVTRIWSYAFYYCSELEYMQLPFLGPEVISYTAGDNTLSYIFGMSGVPNTLKKVVLTGGVAIGDSGFRNCSSLQEIVLPESTTILGYSAFENCSQLQRVIVPGDLEWIKDPDMLKGAPNAMLYISAGQENTKALVESSGIPYKIGGLITFNDENGHMIDKVWYSLNAAISTPVVPEKPADDFCTYKTTWEPVPTCCIGNQTVQLRYIPQWIDGERPGDMNGDGEATDADAIYLLRYTLFPESFPIVTDGDVNCDGQITDADAIYLLRHTLFPASYPLYPGKKSNA